MVMDGNVPQVGLATIAAAVQRAGGSTAHPGTALDEALEQRAAFIEGGAGPEASSIGMANQCTDYPGFTVQSHHENVAWHGTSA